MGRLKCDCNKQRAHLVAGTVYAYLHFINNELNVVTVNCG
jgi:hypothetical protein